MKEVIVTFDPAPQRAILEYPAHYRCRQCLGFVVLALNKKTVIMVQRVGTRSEKPGEVITSPLAPFDNESVWERIPGKSTFTFDTE